MVLHEHTDLLAAEDTKEDCHGTEEGQEEGNREHEIIVGSDQGMRRSWLSRRMNL